MKNNNKVVLIGCGAVGTSFLYAALNQNLFNEYVLIDANDDLAKGNALDFEDASASLAYSTAKIKKGDYNDCADADFVIITAGAAQKPGQTRLELVEQNSLIMKDIATNVKMSGFSGFTIIASNPVDVLTTVYQKVTGFEVSRVIGSGTSLDSARLRHEIGKRLDLNPSNITAFVVGEHGDSSVSVFSAVTVNSIKLDKFKKFTDAQKKNMHESMMKKAYKIINTKRATFYGIGVCLTRLAKAIIQDENAYIACGLVRPGTSAYVGWPGLFNKDGCVGALKLELNAEEKKAFNKSYTKLKKLVDDVSEQIEL